MYESAPSITTTSIRPPRINEITLHAFDPSSSTCTSSPLVDQDGGRGGTVPSRPERRDGPLAADVPRIASDEMGQIVAGYKCFPFGHEAVISGVSDVRTKFTGHARDSQLS
jgi:hypothetical protein